MTHVIIRWMRVGLLLALCPAFVGCSGFKPWSCGQGPDVAGNSCGRTSVGCGQLGCGKACGGKFCGWKGCGKNGNGDDCDDCDNCDDCDDGCFLTGGCLNCVHRRSMAIPDVQPLGSVVRAHYHTMQTNAEAVDFIIHRHEFVGMTSELTPFGKDHIVEIAARMRSAPFPVIIERSENNSDPEMDAHRRDLVAQILFDFGNPDAQQRTFVSPAYGRGLNSREAEIDYYRFLYTRGGFGNFGNNFGNGFGNAGGVGGFGGGGFGF